jgi:CBS-domain-containing membrane protein
VMTTDFISVQENQSLPELQQALSRSNYPFLPVLNARGAYCGLLTADMVGEPTEGVNLEGDGAQALARLIEAKDLLYRHRFQVPTLKLSSSLRETAGIFDETPVVPILGQTEEVVGLLFAHNVRIAYDREVARRSIHYRNPKISRASPAGGDE